MKKVNYLTLWCSLVYKSLWHIILFTFMSLRHSTKWPGDIWDARSMAHGTFKSTFFFSLLISTVSAMLGFPINIHFKSVDHFSKYRLFSGKTDFSVWMLPEYLAEVKCLYNKWAHEMVSPFYSMWETHHSLQLKCLVLHCWYIKSEEFAMQNYMGKISQNCMRPIYNTSQLMFFSY